MASYDPDFHADGPDKGPTHFDPEPRGRGCLFYGCVTAVVLSVLLMLALALAAFLAYRTVVRYLDVYTTTAPVELPRLAMTAEQREEAVARMAAFRDAVEQGRAVEPLVLTGDDLNALVQETRLKDRVYLSLEGDKIKARVSLRLDEIKDISLTRGRYLNGEAEIKASVQEGALSLEIVSMTADGKPLPDSLRNALSQADIVLDDGDEDEEDDDEDERRARAFIRRIESIEVEDGRMIVTPASPPDAPAPPSPPGPPDAPPP